MRDQINFHDLQYSWASFYCGLIYHDITYHTAMSVAERKSDFNLKTDTPYRALACELWGVYCEDLGENLLHFNDTALYLH